LKNETKLTKHNYKSKKEEIGSFFTFSKKNHQISKNTQNKNIKKAKNIETK